MVYNIRKQIGIIGHAQDIYKGQKIGLYKFPPSCFQVFFQMELPGLSAWVYQLLGWMVNSTVYHCLSWYFRMREGISSGS